MKERLKIQLVSREHADRLYETGSLIYWYCADYAGFKKRYPHSHGRWDALLGDLMYVFEQHEKIARGKPSFVKPQMVGKAPADRLYILCRRVYDYSRLQPSDYTRKWGEPNGPHADLIAKLKIALDEYREPPKPVIEPKEDNEPLKAPPVKKVIQRKRTAKEQGALFK